jgi:FAD/FMN-containing dehydrogenase
MRFEKRSLTAEAAVETRLSELRAACAAQGLWPGPLSDLAPEATLGAALLARADRRSVRYGELWDRVLALEAELPGERVVRTRAAPRAATGPDLTRTLLEARGRLGNVRIVWLRLWPAPRERALLRVEAALPALVAGAARLLRAGVRPAEVDLEGCSRGGRLLLALEGEPALVAAEACVARRALEAAGLAAADAAAPAEAEKPKKAASPPETIAVEGAWSELPGLLAQAMDRFAATQLAPARLVWLTHEAAGLACPAPKGYAPEPRERTRADELAAELAMALVRRCV